MVRTPLFWPAHQSYHRRAFAHLLNPALIRIFSSNSLVLSPVTRTTYMSGLNPIMNLHVVLVWLTTFNIGCLTNSTHLDSMPPCLDVHHPGNSSTSTHIYCTCAMQTAKYFCPISLQCRRCCTPSNCQMSCPWWTAQSKGGGGGGG